MNARTQPAPRPSCLRLCLLALPLLLLGLGSRILPAQAIATATGMGQYIAVGGGASAFPSDYDARNLGGYMVFLDLQPVFRYGLESEARFLRYNTNESVTQTNYLIGPRFSFSPGRLRPYSKFLVGATKISAPFGYGQGTFFTFAPGGGADFLLTSRLTLRVVDVEYQITPQFIAGSEIKDIGLSTGISLRLNDLPRLPHSAHLRR